MKALEEDLTDDRSLRLVELMEQASEHAQGDWSQFQSLINRISSQGLSSSAVRAAVERFQLSVALQWDLGEQEVVPLLSDRGSQLVFWDMHRRQICWAHLIRKFAWYGEQGGEPARFGLALLERARVLMREWHRVRDGSITRESFRRNTAATRASVEVMLGAGARLPIIGGSCQHILEHRDALWRFASHDGVEPTNNHAEQEVRSFVLWRKTTLGSQSARGDAFAANLKSVIQTCRKQRRHVLGYLSDAVQASFGRQSAPSLLHARERVPGSGQRRSSRRLRNDRAHPRKLSLRIGPVADPNVGVMEVVPDLVRDGSFPAVRALQPFSNLGAALHQSCTTQVAGELCGDETANFVEHSSHADALPSRRSVFVAIHSTPRK